MAVWSCLILLLSVHLAMNRAAVRAVSLHTLNRQRTNIVFSEYLSKRKVLGPKDVSAQERIFEWDGVLRWGGQAPIGRGKVAVSLEDLLKPLLEAQTVTGSLRVKSSALSRLVEIFADDEYLLWYDCRYRIAYILLKSQASAQDQIKAWAHALWIAHSLRGCVATSAAPLEVLGAIEKVRKDLSSIWVGCMEQMKGAGWDINVANIETASGLRIRLDNFGYDNKQ